ncbi:20465_t:CDS:2 [Cetraspora pellucida]|uniref:20465_t:CDS:1 n=1 Tax=Cetraspora pellucida TaxID=1433469 RepID=A0A9N9NHG9_9GLOM|nr:20465_t:CDS:2 [Cetraspora pellucida]
MVGRPPKNQLKKSLQGDLSPSVYDKYTDLKRKYKELKKKNANLNEECERAIKKIKRCKDERDSLLEQLAKSSIESKNVPISKPTTKYNSSSITPKITSSIIANTKHRSLVRNIVNDIPIKSKVSAPKRGQGRAPAAPRNMKAYPVPKDENGNFILPVEVGLHTVIKLGKIVYDRDSFHNDRYIYPVGYAVKRPYLSMVDPDKNTIYTSRIEDGEDGPRFIVEAEDRPNQPITATSATGAWTPVIKQANIIRERKHSNAASGPDYFGLSQPTIRKMIQELPNAEHCKNYIMQVFELHVPNGAGKHTKKRFSKKYDMESCDMEAFS